MHDIFTRFETRTYPSQVHREEANQRPAPYQLDTPRPRLVREGAGRREPTCAEVSRGFVLVRGTLHAVKAHGVIEGTWGSSGVCVQLPIGMSKLLFLRCLLLWWPPAHHLPLPSCNAWNDYRLLDCPASLFVVTVLVHCISFSNYCLHLPPSFAAIALRAFFSPPLVACCHLLPPVGMGATCVWGWCGCRGWNEGRERRERREERRWRGRKTTK